MANGNLDYTLGQIVQRLDSNDEDHKEIKQLLQDLSKSQMACNNSIIELRTKAKIWGGMVGFLAAAGVAVANWFVKP